MHSRQVALADIRVYPFVRKFLSYHYDTSPFLISSVRNPYSSFLAACLDRYDWRDTKLPKKYAQLTGYLCIGIPPYQIKMFGAKHISPKKQAQFNDFVRMMFFQQLTHEVFLRSTQGMDIKTAAQLYLDRYNISEDDLPIGVALRYYDRVRKKILLDYCPVLPVSEPVNLPHERDSTQWHMESGWGQVA